MQVGDGELPRPGAILVLPHREVRLPLRPLLLTMELVGLVLIDLLPGHGRGLLEHPAGGTTQPLGVHALHRPRHQPGLGRPPLLGDATGPVGSCSAARTITRAWAWLIPPAANASRVAAYLSSSSRASQSPPAITPRVVPVRLAAHASVPVAPSRFANRRRSTSASRASLTAPTWFSSTDASATDAASSSSDNDTTGTPATDPTASRAAASPATTSPLGPDRLHRHGTKSTTEPPTLPATCLDTIRTEIR